jgi:RHS repeat-associated protein
VETINGTDHTTTYTYDKDNRVKTSTTDGVTIEYAYDDFGRIETQITKNGTTVILTESYTYKAPTGTTTSAQVATYTTATPNGYSVTYSYEYDDNGNIISIFDGTDSASYVYDSANQLIRENNTADDYTYTWTYDNAGNILNCEAYTYTTGELGEYDYDTIYIYGESGWRDLLTACGGKTITYDGIGNMLSDGTRTYTWEHGRQLASMSNGSTTWDYTYNADGLRTKRTNGTTTYSYVYNGSQLVQMTKGADTLYFTYDVNGTPLTVTYNGTTYYYVTNLQGDVVAILDSAGTAVATYSYEAWGGLLFIGGTMEGTLGELNPLRYRGYVFDNETGLYYLQSRYYNPEISRFINADAFAATGQGILGNNMFAYCGNNPVLLKDSLGTRHEISAGVCGGFSASSAKGYNQNNVLRKTVQIISTVVSNVDVGVSLGLGMSGNIDTLDIVDLEAGIRYDLISIGYKDDHFYCQQEYFTGIDGTVLVVFDYDFHSENKVRMNPFSKDFGPWEEDKSNDIWTISGSGLYLVGGARYHIGLDILSLIEDLESIF